MTWGQDFDRNYEQTQAAVAELKAALQELDAQEQQKQQQASEGGASPVPAEVTSTPSPAPTSTPDTPAAVTTAAPAAASPVAVATAAPQLTPAQAAAVAIKAAISQQEAMAASQPPPVVSSSRRSSTGSSSSSSNTVQARPAQQGQSSTPDMSVEQRIAFLLQSMGAQPYTPPTTSSGRPQFAAAAATPSSKGAEPNGRRLNQLVDNFNWLPACWYCFNPRVSIMVTTDSKRVKHVNT